MDEMGNQSDKAFTRILFHHHVPKGRRVKVTVQADSKQSVTAIQRPSFGESQKGMCFDDGLTLTLGVMQFFWIVLISCGTMHAPSEWRNIYLLATL